MAIICLQAKAQTYTTKNILLADSYNRFYIQEIPILVSGLPLQMNAGFGLEGVRLTIHHPRTSDLKIQLQAPDGTTSWVTNRNGGLSGANYINTRFSQFGLNGLINNGHSPFTGNYIPDGQFHYFNNAANPNGVWKLLVEDLKEGETGTLDSVSLIFSNQPAFIKQKQYCSFSNPLPCQCNPKVKSGVLLPDMVILPRLSQTQIQEFAHDDSIYPGQIKIAVAIANIGWGPLEVLPDTLLNPNGYGGDTSLHSDKRYKLLQKIYTLSGQAFTSITKPSGTIYFDDKPGHQHYHVDDWVEIRLIKIVKGKKQLMCKGSKVSYCLFTTGMLYEKDSSAFINGKMYGTDMPNYGLGDYYTCSLMKQGITVGGYDYYGLMYEGQYLQLPKAIKNGKYILEIEIDPMHHYSESNKANNVFRMPITLTKQK